MISNDIKAHFQCQAKASDELYRGNLIKFIRVLKILCYLLGTLILI